MGVRDVFVWVVHDRVFVGYAFAGGHGEVGEEGDCCDEGCEGVQEAGLLDVTVSVLTFSVAVEKRTTRTRAARE